MNYVAPLSTPRKLSQIVITCCNLAVFIENIAGGTRVREHHCAPELWIQRSWCTILRQLAVPLAVPMLSLETPQ